MISLRSELRRKVLTFFLMNREARVYMRQLAVALDVDSTNLSRELARLASEGFLHAEPEGRQLYYSVNRAYPYLKPVFALLQGSVGIQPTLKGALQPVGGIESAWIFGSFAKGEADATSDIDLLIVGQPDQTLLSREIRKVERALRREVSYTVFTSEELRRRLARRDPFVTDIWTGKRIEVNGNATTKPQKIVPKQATKFLVDAEKKVVAARKKTVIDEETAYQTAYQTVLKASLALMLSHRQHQRVQLGHHVAILEFAQKHLDPALAPTFDLFDRMRRKRNVAFYDIALIGEVEADEAVAAAEAYMPIVATDIKKRIH